MANRYRGGGGVSLKPENSLKRAEELIGVGQKKNALQTLHDTLTNKRHQRNWNKALEQVMLRHIDLCVETRSGRKSKDALINYRNTVQGMNVGSLELVIDHLLDSATARAEAAQQHAQSKLEDVADLEAETSPEEMMLSYVSGEKSADRTDREVVTPWFKFLWESYRNVLDVLRNNARLEALYAAAAKRACAFCLEHRRTTEFRRLCDILRNHLSNLLRYRDQQQQHRTDISVPATWELYMDMRFEQLRCACELGLWAEAFRSVEDIQGLLALAPKAAAKPRAARMAAYYARLTQIFTRSGARLYNAGAWSRLLAYARANVQGLTKNDMAAMASNVVLSALAVMPYDTTGSGVSAIPGAAPATAQQQQQAADRSARMAAVLGFPAGAKGAGALTRSALLTEAERQGLLALVPPAVRAVHDALESDFDPLSLCRTLAPLLENLDTALGGEAAVSPACPAVDVSLSFYADALREVALARTVRQLSQVYSVVHVSTLSELAPFASFGAVEKLVVEAVRSGYISARFDHRNGTVHFGGRELEGAGVRSHIAELAKLLSAALATPGAGLDLSIVNASAAMREAAVSRAAQTADDANRLALSRKLLIEKRKEQAEAAALEREREAEAARLAAEAATREAEERRKAAERARRETERIQREMEEREQLELKTFLESKGKKVVEGERLDAATITQEVRSEAAKAAADMARRLSKLAKSMDHAERARREEEAPLLKAAWKTRAKEDEALAAEAKAQTETARRAAWERDEAEKQRLESALGSDRLAFASQVQARHAEEFAARLTAHRRAIEAKRQAKREERAVARRREYVRRCRVEIEERRREEEEEAKRIEIERQRREAEERDRKLREIAERQAKREAEIEAKSRAERAAALQARETAPRAPPSATTTTTAAPAADAAAPSGNKPSKFVPSRLRNKEAGTGAGAAAAPSSGGSRRYEAPPPRRTGGDRW